MCPSGECNQLRKRRGYPPSRAAAGGFYFVHQAFFAGTEVDQRLQAIFRQRFCHGAVTIRRPLLGAPARSGIDEDEIADALIAQSLIALPLSSLVMRELYLGRRQR